jgi:ankyrin repeat protein
MNDPASRLPAHPSLEQLRKQAKELLRAHRDGDAAASTRFAAIIPRFANGSRPDAHLADAQFVVAHEYGFDNWAGLTNYLDQPAAPDNPDRRQPIRPIELAPSRNISLPGGGSAPSDAAWEMFLAAHAGDLSRVESLAKRYAGLERFEYNYTPPIHFSVREGHAAVVRFLIERGADLAYRTYPFGDSLVTMADDREHHEVSQLLRSYLGRKFELSDTIAPILDAAKDGYLARVRAELSRDPTLAHAANDLGDTALHRAAENGHLEVVNALLAAGAKPDAVRGDGFKPVHVALMNSWRARVAPERAREIATRLIAAGAEYTIVVAALLGDVALVRNMLARDASLANFEDTCHFRPISVAARRGSLEMVNLLLEHGADPNLPEEGAPRGQALWNAVFHGYGDIARALVARGADPNAMVESSGTPMMHARKDRELYRLLVAHGGDDEPDDSERLERLVEEENLPEIEKLLQRRAALVHDARAFWHEGLLSGAAAKPSRLLVSLLFRYGARVPTVTKWGRFYYFKHTDMVQLLLEHGTNPNHMNWHRTTILHQFASEGDLAKARLLVGHGADIDAIDDEYRSTPLGMAARWGQRAMAEFLLERGADPTAAGAPWATPVAWARKKGHGDIADLLHRTQTG